MRKILVTFSGKCYDNTTSLIVDRGPRMGADDVWVFDDKWLIDSGYVERNRWLFDAKSQIQNTGPWHQHGFGWCSWKGFLILSAFDRLQDGDIVLYLDADTYPIAPFGQLFDACNADGGVLLFEETCSNLRYTKADCMLAMGLTVEDGRHACGRFSLWQKGPFFPRQLLAEWWAYSINPRCTLWDSSILQKDPPEYHRNSTEQSVLSNLARKYSIPLHRGPDQFGSPIQADDNGKDEVLYPNQLFEQLGTTGNRDDLSGSSFRNL